MENDFRNGPHYFNRIQVSLETFENISAPMRVLAGLQKLYCFRILERIGARALSAHLRKFCDYLVYEFTNSRGEQHVNKCVDALNDMIWKYNIVTIDRLVLCLVSGCKKFFF